MPTKVSPACPPAYYVFVISHASTVRRIFFGTLLRNIRKIHIRSYLIEIRLLDNH